jgi:hypothetical protein
MAGLTILYFRESRLEASDLVETDNVIEAMRLASGQRPHCMAEIWSPQGRVAVVRPVAGEPRKHGG